MKLTGIILAGGMGRRMGRNKALVEVGGRPLIERVAGAIESVCDDIIISANDTSDIEKYGYRIVPDEFPGAGVLAGMHAGLAAISTDAGLVVASDMPFINTDLLRFMAGKGSDWDALIPRWNNEFEPLHAIYRKTCLAPIIRRIKEEEKRVVGFYDRIIFETVEKDDILRFDPDGLSFFNVNTQEDLEKANEIAESRGI